MHLLIDLYVLMDRTLSISGDLSSEPKMEQEFGLRGFDRLNEALTLFKTQRCKFRYPISLRESAVISYPVQD